MNPFLDKTAEFLLDTFGTDLASVAVVLPNRRAGLFLRRYLGNRVTRPCWSPMIFSVEDFMSELSGLREAESLSLLFELYDVHRKVEAGKAQSFDDFLRWAPQLLSDFNEVDRHLVDPEQLFTYLDEARILSLWNLDQQPLTDSEATYLRFYHSLAEYYKLLSQRLLASRRGWQGLRFRRAAETISESVHALRWRQVVFAGLNALTRSEEAVIDELYRNRKAHLLWDADEYYLAGEVQEAGTFLREWIRKWPSDEIRWTGEGITTGEKEICIIGTPDAVGQVKYCGQLVQELAAKNKADERAAVVLLDPGLLNPLLNSMPDAVTEMNITAGLPLKQTPLAELFERIFHLHLNTRNFAYLQQTTARKFYYRDVLSLLRHPMIQEMASSLAGNNRFAFEQLIARIRDGSRVFISYPELVGESAGLFGEGLGFLESLFSGWETPREALPVFRSVIESLRLGLMKGHDPANAAPEAELKLELEYLFAFTRILHQLSTILDETGTELSLQTFSQIFRQTLETTTLPFSGEPLKGLQVMGLLETRTLDFEEVILVSCNEDLLPSGKPAPSFIPFDIKRDFGLPTYRHRDAVFAYHFYRLLQRAKRVQILYCTEAGDLGSGDKSRFVRQIEQELAGRYPAVKISSQILRPPPVTGILPRPIRIGKEGDVLERLLKKAETGLSATSLNAFRSCPLKFYYAEIAGIREADELAESINPKVMGQALHEALAVLFKPFKNELLTPDAYTSMLDKADSAVTEAFAKKYKGSDLAFGKNLLVVNVARLLLKRYLRIAKTEAESSMADGTPEKLTGTEEPVFADLLIRIGEQDLPVKMKGFIDRIGKQGAVTRILDYKSGTVKPAQIEVQAWDDLVTDPDLDMAFQLLLYAWLVKENTGRSFAATAAIQPLRKASGGAMNVKVPGNEAPNAVLGEEETRRFREVLETILQRIFDMSQPFEQTDDIKVCGQCPYVTLCGR